MKHTPSRHAPFILLIIALLVANGCARQPAPTAQKTPNEPARERVAGTRGGSLRYRLTSPPKTFNYLMATEEYSLVVSFFLMGGRLVEFDHDTQRYAPGLAESWEMNDDGRTLELTLRAVLPRHVLEEDFNQGRLRDAYGIASDPASVVTAGAFALQSSEPGERVTLKRNPYYWKKDPSGIALPYLDTLIIEV